MLINNAAIARYGALLEQPVSELREVLEADVIGLLALSQARVMLRVSYWKPTRMPCVLIERCVGPVSALFASVRSFKSSRVA